MTVNYEIGKPREDKRMRITLLLCVGKTKKRIKTDLFVTQADLNRKGKVRNDSPIYKKVREKSMLIENEYAGLDTFLTGESITAADAIERMRHADIPSFFEYSDKWLERAQMKGKKNYRTALKNFREFIKRDIPFSFFSHSLLSDYIFYNKDMKRGQSLYFNAIKKIYSDAEKDYDIKPFASFRVDAPRIQRTKNRAVDVDVIRKIIAYKGTTKRSILARDCAILSFCFCGTNSADLYLAPPIKNNTFSYNRAKTRDRREDGAHIEIKVPKQIKALVDKYKGKSHAFVFHLLYKNIGDFNKHLNIGLKKVCNDLNIDSLTFYSFRHSWATIARNDLGIDRWTVHEALNHSGDDTAIDDIYIRKDYKNINIANQKVVDYVFSSEH